MWLGHRVFDCAVILLGLQVSAGLPTGEGTHKPGPPTILPSSLGKIFVRKGEAVDTICFQKVTGNITFPPTVTRGKKNKTVNDFSFKGRCLNISEKDVKQQQYVISLINDYGKAVATFRLIYFEAPGISLYLRNNSKSLLLNSQEVRLTSGDSMDVHCNRTGTPPPNVTWYHDGKVIQPLQYDSSRLFIARVVISDAGLYTVEARNGKGVVWTNFTVHVSRERADGSKEESSSGLPMWAIFVLVICILLVCLAGVIAFFLYRKKYCSGKASRLKSIHQLQQVSQNELYTEAVPSRSEKQSTSVASKYCVTGIYSEPIPVASTNHHSAAGVKPQDKHSSCSQENPLFMNSESKVTETRGTGDQSGIEIKYAELDLPTTTERRGNLNWSIDRVQYSDVKPAV